LEALEGVAGLTTGDGKGRVRDAGTETVGNFPYGSSEANRSSVFGCCGPALFAVLVPKPPENNVFVDGVD